jgi:hypothetical protein
MSSGVDHFPVTIEDGLEYCCKCGSFLGSLIYSRTTADTCAEIIRRNKSHSWILVCEWDNLNFFKCSACGMIIFTRSCLPPATDFDCKSEKMRRALI